MPAENVSNHPLLVEIALFPALLTAGATSNSQYKPFKDSLLTVLPNLPSNVQATLGPLKPDLQKTLGVLFNSAWSPQRGAEETSAAKAFAKALATAGSSGSNVTCSLAASGTVTAQVSPAVSASQPAQLFLNFALPGGNFHFYAGPLGAGWLLDFDASLVISTPAPVTPFGFAPQAAVALSNAQMHADNAGADLDEFFDDLVTDLGNFFTGGNYVSDVDWDANLIQQQTDETQQPLSSAAAAPILSLFTTMNAAGPLVRAEGFTECAFSVTGNQLVLTVTHPLDVAPTLVDADDPPGFITLQAQLSATATEAIPGQQIKVNGIYFPLATSDQLNLQWNNTSSGKATQAQVRWNGQNQTIATPASFNGTYGYTAKSLAPSTTYSFIARCGDALTWSLWSDPLELTTRPTDLVELNLVPMFSGPQAQTWPLGSGPLSKTSQDWSLSAQIPGGAASGLYNLVASSAGVQLASTPITIAATLTPVVDVVDPQTGIVGEAPIFGGLPFTLRGEGFPDGPVSIEIGATAVATPTAVNGGFKVQLETPGNEWTVGVFPLTATAGAASATLNPPIYLEGAPQ